MDMLPKQGVAMSALALDPKRIGAEREPRIVAMNKDDMICRDAARPA